MLRIFQAGRAYAYDTLVSVSWRPSWLLIVPLVLAADIAVATLAWLIVGLFMR
jgi:hypothetical protein